MHKEIHHISMLHRIDLQLRIDGNFSEGIDLLIV